MIFAIFPYFGNIMALAVYVPALVILVMLIYGLSVGYVSYL